MEAEPTVSESDALRELRLLLIWQFPNPTGGRNGSRRRPDQVSTAHHCPQTNRLFRQWAGVDRTWSDDLTWTMLRDRLRPPGTGDPELDALRNLLRITKSVGRDVPWIQERANRQRQAWDIMGWPGPHPKAARDSRKQNSDRLNRLARRLLAELHAIARSETAGRADRQRPLGESARSRIQSEYGALPAYYPTHMTVELLARQLTLTNASTLAVRPSDVPPFDLPGEEPVTRTSALEALADQRRAVLLGEPGAGKSTVVRALVMEALNSRPDTVALIVPAVPFARSLVNGGVDILNAAVDVAMQAIGFAEGEVNPTDVRRVIQDDVSSLLVVDGLDEVFDPRQRVALNRALKTLHALPGRVVLTSRPLSYRRRPGWNELILLPAFLQFPPLIEAWYPRSDQAALRDKAIERYWSRTDLRKLARSPVLAGLLAAAFGESGFEPSSSRSALYEHIVGMLCQREWKDPHHPARDHDEVVALLAGYEAAAWYMAVGEVPGDATNWRSEISYSELTTAGITPSKLLGGELLTPYGTPELATEVLRPWIWLHRTFHEYLAGTRLLQEWRRGGARSIMTQALQYYTAWTEPLVFFLEQSTREDRRLLCDLILELCNEGDPGLVIQAAALALFEPYPDDRERVVQFVQAAGNRWKIELAFNYKLADDPGAPTPAEELLREPARVPYELGSSRPLDEAHELAVAFLLSDTATTSPQRIGALIAAAPREFADYALNRLSQAGQESFFAHSAVMGQPLRDDRAIVDEFWALFDSLRFPRTVPVALAMGEEFMEQPRSTDEYALARWAATFLNDRRTLGVDIVVEAPPTELMDRVLRGEWGPWGAFNASVMGWQYAASLSGLGTHARVGAAIGRTLMTDPFGESDAEARGAFQGDGKPAQLVAAFSARDLDDIDAIERLIVALGQCGPPADKAALIDLLRLSDRLQVNADDAWQTWRNHLVYSATEMVEHVRAVLATTLERFNRRELLDIALDLAEGAGAVSAAAVPLPPSLREHPTEDREFKLKAFRWIAANEPQLLNDYSNFVSQDADEDFFREIYEQLGPRIAESLNFFVAFVLGLDRNAALPRWRPRLLEDAAHLVHLP